MKALIKMNLEKNRSWFAVTPIISNVIFIAVIVGIYFYLASNGLFPEWIHVIYWVVKAIIAFEIIRASARSLVAPLLTLIAGLSLLFALQVYYINFVTRSDAWHLIMMAVVGFVITLLVKLG